MGQIANAQFEKNMLESNKLFNQVGGPALLPAGQVAVGGWVGGWEVWLPG